MKRRATAVLHLNGSSNPNAVLNLALKVIAGFTNNSGVYPNPNPAIAELEAEAKKLQDLIREADTGNHQAVKDRDAQSAKVHGLLRKGINYVNGIADGDRPTILLSGFDASDEPTPQPIPTQLAILRIEDGPTELSAKLMVNAPGEPVDFIVQMLIPGTGTETWTTVLETSNSRQLIVTSLERAREVHFRVCARNARGQGPWSDPVPFIPR